MRTTIRLDDALLTEAKALAARTGRTLTKVVEDALRETLARRPATDGPRPRTPLPTDDGGGRGGGLRSGVDLDDTAALLDLMERDDPS
ncbi:MAG: type II toxin-antitoxin system VapB family antitoxin [Actinomycetota bacterium]